MWTWLQASSTALHDAANLTVILDPLALLKKDSQIRAYQCHPAPHRCQARCNTRWMDWRMWFYQVPGLLWKMEGPSAWSFHNSPRDPRPPSKRSKLPSWGMAAPGPCWQSVCSWVTRKHEQRLLLKGRSTPYLPNKEKGQYDDESDRSLSSLSSVRELMLKEAKANLCLPFLRELMLPWAARMTLQGPHSMNGWGQSKFVSSLSFREWCSSPCILFHHMSRITVRICLLKKTEKNGDKSAVAIL